MSNLTATQAAHLQFLVDGAQGDLKPCRLQTFRSLAKMGLVEEGRGGFKVPGYRATFRPTAHATHCTATEV